LSYISTHLQNVAEVFVLFPDGKLFQLFPQSSVTFEEEMVLEAGLSGRYATLWTGNTGDEKYLSTTHFYWKNLQAYLTQQIGSTFTASPTVQALNRKLLSYLVHIFPGFFEQNVKNAKQFTYYFSLFDDTSSFLMAEKYFISPDVSAERSLWSQIKQNIELAFPLLKSF
jgi:hypothetical protein